MKAQHLWKPNVVDPNEPHYYTIAAVTTLILDASEEPVGTLQKVVLMAELSRALLVATCP